MTFFFLLFSYLKWLSRQPFHLFQLLLERNSFPNSATDRQRLRVRYEMKKTQLGTIFFFLHYNSRESHINVKCKRFGFVFFFFHLLLGAFCTYKYVWRFDFVDQYCIIYSLAECLLSVSKNSEHVVYCLIEFWTIFVTFFLLIFLN